MKRILTGKKNTGKRLLRFVVEEINSKGVVEVVALTKNALHRLVNLGQKVSNETGLNIQADPYEEDIEITTGEFRRAFMLRLSVVKPDEPKRTKRNL